jgi:hypothetical protein
MMLVKVVKSYRMVSKSQKGKEDLTKERASCFLTEVGAIAEERTPLRKLILRS